MADVTQFYPGIGVNGITKKYIDNLDGTHSEAMSTAVAPAASELHIGSVTGISVNPSTTLTRPNDTTAYASGDLVANSTTASAVAALQFTVARVAGGSFQILKGRLSKTKVDITNAAFRLHLFGADPTSPDPTNGDNGAFVPSAAASYLGAIDFTSMILFTDGAAGNGAPLVGSSIVVDLSSGQVIYGLLEARGAYTPAAQEVFTLTLEVFQD